MQRRTCDKIILLDEEKEMLTQGVCNRRYLKRDGTESKSWRRVKKV